MESGAVGHVCIIYIWHHLQFREENKNFIEDSSMIIQCTDWVQSKQLTTKLMFHIFSVMFETNVHIFFSKIAILDYVQRWCHPGFVDGQK